MVDIELVKCFWLTKHIFVHMGISKIKGLLLEKYLLSQNVILRIEKGNGCHVYY